MVLLSSMAVPSRSSGRHTTIDLPPPRNGPSQQVLSSAAPSFLFTRLLFYQPLSSAVGRPTLGSLPCLHSNSSLLCPASQLHETMNKREGGGVGLSHSTGCPGARCMAGEDLERILLLPPPRSASAVMKIHPRLCARSSAELPPSPKTMSKFMGPQIVAVSPTFTVTFPRMTLFP